MTPLEFSDYRQLLRSILVQRIQKNREYSLRAMARDLGVATSTLSEVMNGKANLSVLKARKISKALKLKLKESAHFCDLVQLEQEKDMEAKREILLRLKKRSHKTRFSDLDVERFAQISEWYHHAIMELCLIPTFVVTPESIATTLQIPKPIARLAIQRLMKLGVIAKNEAGLLERRETEHLVRSENRNQALRQFYRQMFERASVALTEQTPQERLSGFLALPLDPAAIPKVDDAITKFFEEIRNISSLYENKTEVYHMMVHFFNLRKKD